MHAELNVASRKVIRAFADRHRQEEYIECLHLVERRTTRKKVLHLIVDNASSHNTPKAREFLGTRPGRFVVHLTPTPISWLNLVEGWFSEITTKLIRRGSWNSVDEPERAITDYIHHWNDSGKHFVWAKSSEQILARGRETTPNQ